MGDTENGALAELLSDGILYPSISFIIDTGSSLVQDQDPRIFDQGPAKRENLPLSQREVLTVVLDKAVQRELGSCDCSRGDRGGRHTARSLKSLVENVVSVEVERIEILADGSAEQHGLLRDDGEVRTEIVEAKVKRVHTIYGNGTALWLAQSVQGSHNGGLSSTGTATDTNLLARVHMKRKIRQHVRELWSVTQEHMGELYLSPLGPIRSGFLLLGGVVPGLLRQLKGVLGNPLDTAQVLL